MTYTQLAVGFPKEGELSPVVTVEWTPGGDTMRLRIRVTQDSAPLVDIERPTDLGSRFQRGEIRPNSALMGLILELPHGELEPTAEGMVRQVWNLADDGAMWWPPTSALPSSTRELLGA